MSCVICNKQIKENTNNNYIVNIKLCNSECLDIWLKIIALI